MRSVEPLRCSSPIHHGVCSSDLVFLSLIIPWPPLEGSKPSLAAHLTKGSPGQAGPVPAASTTEAGRGLSFRHIQDPQAGCPVLLFGSREQRLTHTAPGTLTPQNNSWFCSPGRSPSSILLCRGTLGCGINLSKKLAYTRLLHSKS